MDYIITIQLISYNFLNPKHLPHILGLQEYLMLWPLCMHVMALFCYNYFLYKPLLSATGEGDPVVPPLYEVYPHIYKGDNFVYQSRGHQKCDRNMDGYIDTCKEMSNYWSSSPGGAAGLKYSLFLEAALKERLM